jgi:hypothetical protein
VVSGNVIGLVAPALIAGWWLAARDHQLAGGLVLVVAAFKPQTCLLLLPALVAAGRWRAAVTWLAALSVLVLASAASLGTAGLEKYRQLLAVVASFPVQQNLSLPHFLHAAWLIAVVDVALIVLVVGVARRYRNRTSGVPLAVALCASLMVTPYLNGQDFVLVVLAGLLLLRESARTVESVVVVGMILAATLAADNVPQPLFMLETIVLLWIPFLKPALSSVSKAA